MFATLCSALALTAYVFRGHKTWYLWVWVALLFANTVNFAGLAHHDRIRLAKLDEANRRLGINDSPSRDQSGDPYPRDFFDNRRSKRG
jgi:hypothetical protein